jgi:Cu(I)/Ag(I) efflux system membrane fusion protein
MNGTRIAALVLGVAATTLGLGYWLGSSRNDTAGHAAAPAAPAPPSARASAQRKILYYRHPMGLPDTSPEPRKDAMGMDYIPVYEGEAEEPAPGAPMVKISLDKLQKLGVRTEPAAPRPLVRTLSAVATIQPAEGRLHSVAPRFEGWIQKLHVNTTGQAVRRGEPLMDVYSPDLITAQEEYLIALRGMQATAQADAQARAGMQRLVDGAIQRLRNWEISDTELRGLQHEGKTRQYLTLRSPVDGIVLDKPPVQGMRFMAGEMLYRIADLSSVWMLAEVFEQDLHMVHPGQTARIRVDAYSDKVFDGTITFVYPTVSAETRTTKVRIELPNPEGLLKPDMFVRAEIASSHGGQSALMVPDSAVLDTGTRQVVLVSLGAGRFEPRSVKLGMRADGYSEVLDGVVAGEDVVVAANFLIDAESQLKSALGAFGGHAHGGAPPAGGNAEPPATESSATPSQPHEHAAPNPPQAGEHEEH